MKKVRIIPRLDVKGPNVVKGIQLEGLRVVGNPSELARKYYEQGADEILYIDIVASLYNRNNLTHIIEETTEKGVFIPITVAGGIRSIEDITAILRSGADKVAINTAAVRNPELLKEAVNIFGASTIILSVEAKKVATGKWEAYTDNGREQTGLDVIEWIKKAQELGVGEVLITSVDREGTKRGYDMELIDAVCEIADVPVVVSGGAGSIEDIHQCLNNKCVDGLTLANVLHYETFQLDELKYELERTHQGYINNNFRWHDNKHETIKGHVSLLDYGLGNLSSIHNAFRQIGADVSIISTAEEIDKAEYLVLPGVGAFGHGMQNLTSKKLISPLKSYAATGKPLLGICLGMQLLMSKSYEFGEHDGLDIIRGEVLAFQKNDSLKIQGYKIPHVGWNQVYSSQDWKQTILNFAEEEINAYFVHSFYVQPENPKNVLAKTQYFDQEFCSVLRQENIYGCQFHPEKSQEAGLNILKEILKLDSSIKV